MPCNVVCISHTSGSAGDEVGRMVAEQLGFLYVDEEIVAHTAERGGVEARDVADEERRKSLAARLLAAIAEGGGDAWALAGTTTMPYTTTQLQSTEIRALIRETIEQTAARGNVVIVAHAASHALEPDRSTLRVLVTASPSTRAQRLAGADRTDAKRMVKESDAGRRDYLKRFYEVDEELPTHYDLVLNTDVLSAADAARLVVAGSGQTSSA
jgi:hypothetical protein